ncbi:thymidylate kinase-like protein [Backusella circina FSU 941]|nr:thymidylate kinase-like protein [Backusella circina FSU 941]
MSQRGLLIVVEGCDRSGKSTQCERLVTELVHTGTEAQLVKFPDRTTQTGKMIDDYLKNNNNLDDHAIHLLFSANRWEAMQTMFDDLNKGKTLVVDRYAFSGVAFSSAKGLDLEWCRNPDVGLLSPDVVLFLDLDIEEAEKRGGFGMERYEKRELQVKVRGEFSKLQDDKWKFIDASQSMEKVQQDMWEAVQGIKALPLEELKYNLWK